MKRMGLRARAGFLASSFAILGGCGSSDGAPMGATSTDAGTASDATGASDAQGSTDAARADSGHTDSGTTAHDSGTTSGDGGTQPTSTCKRGIASNIAPSAAFAHTSTSPGITWWYNWSTQPAATPASIEFDPMIWGSGSLNAALPSGSPFVLGFNEPNFSAQSNLTPQQAAADWPTVETNAHAVGAKIVSPAVNFCGSASDTSGCSDPSVTDPYTYLKDFFSACPGCEVDAIAVHWYNCDLPSLKAYIDGNSSLEGFVQFGKPIWLTEVSCDGSHSVADQQAYMEAVIPYLEGNADVARYSWFSSTAIASAQLTNGDGSLTALGTTYVGLAENCP
jgi:hypothetical protein